MGQRFLAIWFPYLITDRFSARQPQLKSHSFVLAVPEHGRMVIKALNPAAAVNGIANGMVVADARALLPSLKVFDYHCIEHETLYKIAVWCLRYTPVVSITLPDGLMLDVSGCPHLWGGELPYLKEVITRLNHYGYHARAAIADTPGAAWAIARYGKNRAIIEPGQQLKALLPLPPAALRIEATTAEKLEKLGLHQIAQLTNIPRSALRRRFGPLLITRLNQAFGQQPEPVEPIKPAIVWQERLPCPEPIATARGIELALEKLLNTICTRLAKEEKGVRTCVFTCYRTDGNLQQLKIETNRPSRNSRHLFKLFELKIATLQPGLGFEVFVLEAPVTENLSAEQEALWAANAAKHETAVAELLDKIAVKLQSGTICRYLPAEHYLPERCFKKAASLQEQPATQWPRGLPRPLHLLPLPQPVKVLVALPDYPPMAFYYNGQHHKIIKADGPERIEQEWWLQQGYYRDYYCLEDEEGLRYWLFRLGDYNNEKPEWFIHGFFA